MGPIVQRPVNYVPACLGTCSPGRYYTNLSFKTSRVCWLWQRLRTDVDRKNPRGDFGGRRPSYVVIKRHHSHPAEDIIKGLRANSIVFVGWGYLQHLWLSKLSIY